MVGAVFVKRAPWPEFTVLIAGIVFVVTAGRLGLDGWATVCGWLCIFAVVAVVVTRLLSTRSTGTNFAALTVGVVAATWGVLWYAEHKNEPYILSPVFLGYLGGGLAVSAIITLMCRAANRQPRKRL